MSATFKPLGDFLRVLIAPAIWLAHLSIVYGAEALICIGPPADRTTRMGWMIFLATSAAVAGLAILVVGLLRRQNTASSGFDRGNAWLLRASLLLSLLSALGIVWTTLPATILPACGPRPSWGLPTENLIDLVT
jgi:hypothetical protein